ncbi:DUF6292 family protein [Saccharopolyspora shandongensis]|uniref:DUF6292 family protein n=1 Tax=Saccharopolyspora shandongensis TaxID=418495 RepID=UPI003401AEBA
MDTMSLAADGLVGYVTSVAEDLDVDVFEIDINLDVDLATVIILVDAQVPVFEEFPLLLTWDEVSGWALRIDTDGRGATAALEFLGEDILPDSVLVRRFLWDAVRGNSPGVLASPAFRLPNARDDLEQRLTRFCN